MLSGLLQPQSHRPGRRDLARAAALRGAYHQVRTGGSASSPTPSGPLPHLACSRMLTRHFLPWSAARRPLSSRRHRLSVTCAAAGEAPEQALQRRLRESQRVDERVKYIYNIDDWHRELAGAGSGLVVLEVRWREEALPSSAANAWRANMTAH